MKKILALLIAGIMVAVLAACGESTTATMSAEKQQTTEVTTEKTTAKVEKVTTKVEKETASTSAETLNAQQTVSLEETTTVPETVADVPETTVNIPETTTSVPETTANVPETTISAPETAANVPETTTAAPETTAAAPGVLDDGICKYVAIGNSIAIHGATSSWWNECGMAASTADNDYFHIVSNYLWGAYGNVDSCVVNLSSWELQWYDRYECLYQLDGYLEADTDIVSIQLGENITDSSSLFNDFVDMLNYIWARSPHAQIIIVDNFWTSWDVSSTKQYVADYYGLGFANLSEIAGNSYYQCGYGTAVYDAEGGVHYVNSDGVAMHPGDAGMAYIANSIINNIQ